MPLAPRHYHHPRNAAFTAMELIIVMLIMAIVAVLSIDSIATFEANQRAERGARETLDLFRYARNLAMSTGKNAKVEVNKASKTIAVYWMSNGSTWDATPVTQSLTGGGTMLLNFSTARDLAGSSFTINPANNSSFIYGPLGSCAATGRLTFSCGTKQKQLLIAAVGDPALN